MEEHIDYLGDELVFSTLDANWGYSQVETDRRNRGKTAFISHYGPYRYKGILFAQKNAPSTFHRAMDGIFPSAKWQLVLVYLDGMVTFSRAPSKHLAHVQTVFTLLLDAGVSLKLPKCLFYSN